jgi:hypothetical protein
MSREKERGSKRMEMEMPTKEAAIRGSLRWLVHLAFDLVHLVGSCTMQAARRPVIWGTGS